MSNCPDQAFANPVRRRSRTANDKAKKGRQSPLETFEVATPYAERR